MTLFAMNKVCSPEYVYDFSVSFLLGATWSDPLHGVCTSCDQRELTKKQI